MKKLYLIFFMTIAILFNLNCLSFAENDYTDAAIEKSARTAEENAVLFFNTEEGHQKNETADVPLEISNVNNLGGIELNILYDPAFMTVNSVALGNFLGSTGRAATVIKNSNDTENGIVSFTAMTFAGPDGPSGNGVILTMNITTTATGGATGLTLTDVQFTDTVGTVLSLSLTNKTIFIGTMVTAASTTQTIDENTSTPTISLTANLSAAITADTTVTLTPSGSAIINEDYTLSGTTLSILQGTTSVTQEMITIIDDNDIEGTETIILTMTDSNNASIGTPSQYVIYITDDDKPTVNWSMSAQTVSESSGTATITATLDQAFPTSDVVVSYSVSGSGSATAGSDFISPSGSITITAGSLSQSFTIPIIDDTTNCESDETIILTMSQPDNSHLGTTSEHTITIAANDPTISFRESMTGTATEGDVLVVYADLCIPVNESVSFSCTVSGTVSAQDHNYADKTLTIAPNSTVTSTSITITDDTSIEDQENLVLNLSNATNGSIGTLSQYTVSITDNDVPTVNWSMSTQTISENSATVTITATLDQAYPSTEVVIPYAVSGSATPGSDFVAPSGSLTVPAGELFQTDTITITNDTTTCETDESIILTMSKPSNAKLGDTTVQTITISANDPTITWASGLDNSTNEGNAVVLTAELCVAIAEQVSVPYTVGGTAISSDHDLTDSSLTFNANTTSTSVTINIADDDITCESDETIIVALDTSSVNVFDGALTSHTLTINQNDPVISWTSNDTETSEGNTIQMVVSSCVLIDSEITVPVSITGTVETSDYTPEITSIAIPANQQTGSVSITATDDGVTCETDETLILTLGKPANAYTNADMARTITITKNDPTVAWTTTSQDAAEGDLVTIIAEICMAQDQDIQITVDTGGSVDTGDYTVSTLTIPATQTQGSLSAKIVSDTTNCETTENLTLTIVDDTTYYAGTDKVHNISIAQDTSLISWTLSQLTVSEDVNIVSLTATTCLQKDQAIEIPFTISGTAQSEDHDLTDGVFEISANSDNGVLTFTVFDDTDVEPNETLSIEMGEINGADTQSPDTIVVTIEDDDLPYLTITSAQTTLSENAGTVMITVTADQKHYVDMFVDYSVSGDVNSSDYNLANGTLKITADNLSANILLEILDDNRDEDNESLVITLSNPQHALINQGELTLTITDNDTPVVQFSSSSQDVDEDAGTVSVDITMDILSDFDISIPYTLGGTAQNVDYTFSSGNATIDSDTQTTTLSIPINDDVLDEVLETLQIFINVPDKANVGTIATHTISITDNDIPVVSWQSSTKSVDENVSSTTLIAVMDTPPCTDVLVQYTVSGSATPDDDYVLADGSFTITANESMVELPVQINEDEAVESHETVVVTLTQANNATVGTTNVHTLTIMDNDIPKLGFGQAAMHVTEASGTVTLTITLDKPSVSDVTATYTVSGDSALGEDHNLNDDSISIGIGSTQTTIFIDITDDPSTCEDKESLIVTLSDIVNANPDSITEITIWIYDICPSFENTSIDDVNEDSGEQTIASFATQITSNTPFELPLTFDVTPTDTSLFAVNPAISETGTLTFTPEDNAFGSSDVSVTLKSGSHIGETKTFTITILPVNDPPTFTLPNTLKNVNEDSSGHTYENWLTQIVSGPANESDQTLQYSVNNDNAALFVSEPSITDGTLTFSLASNENGKAVVTVQLIDNGSSDNGGTDTSISQSFTIVVAPINDPPENTLLPEISGIPQKDQVITSTNGTWNDDTDIAPGTLSYSYQWQQSTDAKGSFTDIAGETDADLTLASLSIGKYIRLKVTCTDDGEGTPATQATSVYSNVIGDVQDVPVIQFGYISENEFHENAGVIQLPIRIEKALAVDAEYDISVSGTASESDDYLIVKTQTIKARATSAQLSLTIIDDTADEPFESITLTIISSTHAKLGTHTQIGLLIKASDATPTISNISPNSGFAGKQSLVTITGTRFMPGVTVTIDDVDALNVIRESETTIKCVVPQRGDLESNTTVALAVINPGGLSATSNFTYETMRTISGQVLAANDSHPITDCVILLNLPTDDKWSTTTDMNGNYSITDLPISDRFIISAWPDKDQAICYQSQYYDDTDRLNATQVSTISNDATANFSLPVCDNGVIQGTVHNLSDAPITTGTFRIEAYSDELGESRITKASANGSYTFNGLKPATDYKVCAEWSETSTSEYCYTLASHLDVGTDIPDTCSVIDMNDGRSIPVNANTTANIDIIIDPVCSGGKITGRIVKCDGSPAANVYVFAHSDYFGIKNGTKTDLNGDYEINALIPVSVADITTKGYIVGVVFRGYPVHYYGDTVILANAQKVGADSTGIDLQQNCYGISGQVTDSSGGVPNVFMMAWSASVRSLIYPSATDINGNYTLTNLKPANDYVVFASPMDFAQQYYDAKDTPNQADLVDITGGHVNNIDFFIECGVKLCGKIFFENTSTTMPEGTPVNISSEDADFSREVLTDANGNFEICDLDASVNDYIISVFIKGYPTAFYNSAGTVFDPAAAEEVSPSATCDKDIVMIKGYKINGKIADNGTMISGVSVEAVLTTGPGYDRTVSHKIDAMHNYELQGLVPGTYDVSISPPGQYMAETKPVTIVDGDVTLDFDLLKPSRTLSGTIHNLGAGQTVWIYAWSGSGEGFAIVQGNGDVPYTITGLKPASNYRVQLSSDDVPDMYYDGTALFHEATKVDLSEYNAFNIDFTIESLNNISGAVNFVGGKSGDMAFVRAFSSTMGSAMALVTFDQPNYTFKVKPANNYAVSVWSNQYQASPEKTWVDTSAGDVNNIDFELSEGRYISGTISNESGQPVSNITVEISSLTSGSKSGETNANGEYLVTGLGDIDDAIVIVHAGKQSPAFYYSIDGTVRNIVFASTLSTTDGNLQNIDLEVIQGTSISGIVVSESYKFLKNISVEIVSEALSLRHSIITDANGMFSFSRLPEGNDYEITARPPSTSPYQAQAKDRIASKTSTVFFTLSQAFTVSGLVTDNDGDPVSNVEVELFSDQKDYYGYCQTDDSGAYEINGVPEASDMVIIATASGSAAYLPYKSRIGVINGNHTENISLTPAFNIWGYITDSDGQPVENAMIKGNSLSKTGAMRMTISDDQGYYEIKNVPASSDYIIGVTCDNYAGQKKTSQVSGTQVDFVLSSASTVSGFIRDSNNQPIKGVLIEISSATMGIKDAKASDINGYYAFTGLPTVDLSGNYITDYEIKTASIDYAPGQETQIKAGDQVNLTLIDASSSVVTGTVTDASGVKASGKVYVKLYKDQGGFVKYCSVETDGDFECGGLVAGVNYELKIKTKNIGNSFNNRYQWVGAGDTPTSLRTNAQTFTVGDVVNYQYGEDWQ